MTADEPLHTDPAPPDPSPFQEAREPAELHPEPARGPRIWPRIVGVLILLLGVAGAWAWQNPTVFRALLPAAGPDESQTAAINSLEARVARLEQRPQPDLAALTQRLDALENRPAPPASQPAGSAAPADLRPILARLDALEARPTFGQPVAPDLGPLRARLDVLEQALADRKDNTAKVEALAAKVDALSARDPSAEFRARLDEMAAKLNDLADTEGKAAENESHALRLARLEAAAIALEAGHPLGAIADAPPPLAHFAAVAPPTEAALRLSFGPAAQEALKVSKPETAGKPFFDRVLARLQDFRLITVREGDHVVIGSEAAATLAQAETLLDAGDLAGAAREVATLTGAPAEKMARWLADAKALLAAREALAGLAEKGLMHRILKTLFWGALVFVAAWFIASLPGRLSLEAGSYTVETSDSIALTTLLLLFLVLYVVARLITHAVLLPRHGSRWRGGRRRRAGDQAVTRALVALAAGEKGDARREAHRARALLGDTPQTLLLAAEAGRLAGRDDEATAALQALSTRPDSAFLGLRGLLASAITREDWPAAARLAREAEAAHPGAAWLRQERSQLAIRAGDWAEALALAAPDGPKAALATGAALAETNPDRAERLARQALKVDPSFTPAVLALAGRLRARGKEKPAQAVLADGWKRAPHPDIAAFALAPVADKLARAQAAQALTAGAVDDPETHLLLARTALDAGVTGEARRHLEAARNAGFDQRRLWLLLAELEEEERGDTEAGRTAQRDALRRAAGAAPDPVWRCGSCHSVQPVWRAACPVCLTPGSLVWSAEALGAPVITHAA